jgi:malate dehydrogenase (oxaloacetate-decarboxylating)
MPDIARKAGAAVVGTGRSDFPNQINNVLAFPGIFRGALDARARRITDEMKVAAAHTLSGMVKEPTRARILPGTLNRKVAYQVAAAVEASARECGCAIEID